MMRRSPKGCCETPSKARLYAFTSVCNEFFASDDIFVGTAVTSPSSFCQANPKCGLPGFFRGTAVWRSQAFARAFSAQQRFRRYDASLLPVFALSGAIPNAACQASSKARPYAAYRRLQWVFRVRRHFRRYSSYSPVLAFCQAQSQMWLAKFLPRCGHIPFAGVCTGIPRPAAFSSVKRAPVFALSGGSRVQLAELFQRHGCMPLAGVCAGTPRRQRFRRYDASLLPRPRFLPGTVPNAACQTSSETRLYAAYRRLHGHSAPAAFSSVRRIATPRLRFVRRNPKCSLPGFFQGTAVCRLQAFARAFRARQRFRRHSAPRSRPFLVPSKTPYRAGLPFSHIAAAWPRVGDRMFYESIQKCRWFRHAATIPAKGRLRVVSNLESAEMALAKALPDADGRCGK